MLTHIFIVRFLCTITYTTRPLNWCLRPILRDLPCGHECKALEIKRKVEYNLQKKIITCYNCYTKKKPHTLNRPKSERCRAAEDTRAQLIGMRHAFFYGFILPQKNEKRKRGHSLKLFYDR